MSKRKGKSASFDAMVKFFLMNYNIPTTKDIDRLNARLDRLEALIIKSGMYNKTGKISELKTIQSRTRRKKTGTASDTVLGVIRKFRNGVSFGDIQDRTSFEDKKLRNIIYRLDKNGKIQRKSRGIYIVI